MPLALYCRASMAPSFDPGALFTLTKNGLDFFNELFDFPYPWGKYDQAFVPEYNLGAMENPGLVTFTENYVFTSRAADSQYQARANTLLHEMAHMWFGDLVTMQWWDDLWLKESFADYMGTLGVDRTTDWDTAWVNFANNRKAWAYVQDQLPTTHPIVADIPDLEAAKQNFDGITYAKGASVLKQLVAYVGFEAFVAGSRQYFKDHAYGNTTLADLLAALSAASGRDLADWARQWLQTSGISTLTTGIEEHDGVLGTVTLHQDAEDPDDGPAGAAAAPAADRPVRDGRRRRPGPHGQRRDRRQRRPDRGAGPGRQAAAGPAAGQRRRPQLRQGPAGPALRSHCPGLAQRADGSDGPGPVLDRALGFGPGRRHAGVPLRGRRAALRPRGDRHRCASERPGQRVHGDRTLRARGPAGTVSAAASCPWRPTSCSGPRRAPTSSWHGHARSPRPAATTAAGWTCSAASWTAAR